MEELDVGENELEKLQKDTFGYFLKETNPENGLVADNSRPDSHSSIAAVGLALSCYCVAVERGFMTRAKAVQITLTTLRFFWESPQGKEMDATGYKGFYYHFLDMKTGRRAWKSELSSIDTTFFIIGALTAAQYFDQDNKEEGEIRKLGNALYRRVDWNWMLNKGKTVRMGWKPESGFLKYRWEGYNEALLLYTLGLASPTFPIPAESYHSWLNSYQWEKLYGIEFLYAGPLFIHQLSHVWIDFRGIQDVFMRGKGIDYFENSRRATYVQQQYALLNPKNFKGYEKNCWGITASDGPGPVRRKVNGTQIRFYDYKARKIPFGPDDGTIAPWAVIASLPFAPEIVLPALKHFNKNYPQMRGKYGFTCSFNPSFKSNNPGENGWVSKSYYGLDQGPVILMIENYRTGFLWGLMRGCPYISEGLRRACFTGSWLKP